MVQITRTEYMRLGRVQKLRTKHRFWKIESSALVSAEIRASRESRPIVRRENHFGYKGR